MAGYGLEGRVAVVTGGAQGIGREFCRALAAAGAAVAVADINMAKAGAVAAEIGEHATAFAVNVAEPASVTAFATQVQAHFGRVDVLVNNAALFSSLEVKPFHEITDAEWNSVLAVNVTGVFNCCRAFAPGMMEAGYGRIVNVASAAAKMGRPNYLHYIASKGAVEAMTRSLARELGGYGISANVICPGAIFTEIPRGTVTEAQKAAILASQCVPRPGVPDDLVSTLLHLASPRSGFVTGQSFVVDGGVVHAG